MEQLTVVSTKVQDRIINATGNIVARQAGGPAKFITQALDNLAMDYKLITSQEMAVEIIISPGHGEIGRVINPNIYQQFPVTNTKNILISTLCREWDIKSLINCSARIWLDVQGFVRDPAAGFGKKQIWNDIRIISPNLFFLKATEEEACYLPPDALDEQKQKRGAIITKGADGADLFFCGQYWSLKPPARLSPPDTIGAGDTLFANLVAAFIKGSNILEAAQIAINQTTIFLKSKK